MEQVGYIFESDDRTCKVLWDEWDKLYRMSNAQIFKDVKWDQ